MADIKEILGSKMTEKERIEALMQKTVTVPVWGGPRGLVNEYDPRKHPVMDRAHYRDLVRDNGVEHVTRITLDLQRLAAKRMGELVCGIPVKRVCKPENDTQKQIAAYLEAVFTRNRIDSVNTDRCHRLFAGCEVFTLWYAVAQRNTLYGFDSPLKLRCRTFSPMLGDELYPFFDEYGDMTAMSIAYTRTVGDKSVRYFDSYTAATSSGATPRGSGSASRTKAQPCSRYRGCTHAAPPLYGRTPRASSGKWSGRCRATATTCARTASRASWYTPTRLYLTATRRAATRSSRA